MSIDDGLQSVELGEYSSTRETGLPRHTVTSGKQPYLQILSTDLIDIYTEVQGNEIFSDDKFTQVWFVAGTLCSNIYKMNT